MASSRLMTSATLPLPMRSHAEVLRIVTSTHQFWGQKPAQSSGLARLQRDLQLHVRAEQVLRPLTLALQRNGVPVIPGGEPGDDPLQEEW